MSWLARSLASSLKPDALDDDDEGVSPSSQERSSDAHGRIEPETSGRGVKEDLSELTETLTRQFWGVASFLAPPPPPPPPPPPIRSSAKTPLSASDQQGVSGIRSEFAEIGGRFRTGIARISNNAAVSEISKIASNFLPFGSERDDEREEEEDEEEEFGWTYSVSAVGLTDEVLAFARNISMHPETWLDFPLFYDLEDCNDFDMSDAQQGHAMAVELLLPRLAALRIELCPAHMTEGCFWKIYFVLLHSRLNKHDAELLSTSQIVEAKAMLLQRLQSQMKQESEISNRGASSYRNMDDARHPPESRSVKAPEAFATSSDPPIFVSESVVVEEEPTVQSKKNKDIPGDLGMSIRDYGDGDEWLEEESLAAIPLIDEEDVSFSDLEEDDDVSSAMPRVYKGVIASQTTKERSNDYWLDADDDFDSFMRQ